MNAVNQKIRGNAISLLTLLMVVILAIGSVVCQTDKAFAAENPNNYTKVSELYDSVPETDAFFYGQDVYKSDQYVVDIKDTAHFSFGWRDTAWESWSRWEEDSAGHHLKDHTIAYIGSASTTTVNARGLGLDYLWRVTYKNVGKSTDGRSINAEVTCTSARIEGLQYDDYMNVFDVSRAWFESATANDWTTGTRLRCTLRLEYADTGALFDKSMMFSFHDMDVIDDDHGGDYNEGVGLMSGYDAFYINNPTILKREIKETSTGDTYPIMVANDPDGTSDDYDKRSALIVQVPNGKFEFIWQGCGCGTCLISKPYVPPKFATPKKSPATQIDKLGGTATFNITQYVSWYADSNKPASIRITDKLDDIFDVSRASDIQWSVKKSGSTSNKWEMSFSDGTVTFTPTTLDPNAICGETVFTITVPIKASYNLNQSRFDKETKPGYVGVPNQAVLHMKKSTRAKETNQKTSEVKVYVPYWNVEIEKVSNTPSSTAKYPLSSARFTIYDSDDNVVKKNCVAGTEYAIYTPGTYRVEETVVPDGYDKAPDGTCKLTSSNAGTTVKLKMTDEFTAYGTLEIQKTSNRPAWVNELATYSLANAKYGIYESKADANNDSNRVATVKTDENGIAKKEELYTGKYYVKELTPSLGHKLDTTVYEANVPNKGQTVTVKSTEPVHYYETNIIAEKLDAQLKKHGEKQGDAELKKAWFLVDFYDTSARTGNPKSSAVFETDENGDAKFATATPVEGTWKYKDDNGNNVIPLGWVTVTEVRPPKGYIENPKPVKAKVSLVDGVVTWTEQ